MNDLIKETKSVIQKLESLHHSDLQETSKALTATIQEKIDYLNEKNHRFIFIGPVGIGKSSLIGIATGLLVGEPPKDRRQLKELSVLTTGSGRTTVCEIRIRATRDTEPSGLILNIEPFSMEEMEKEIRIHAEESWRRRQPATTRSNEEQAVTPQEIQRLILGMTGYTEYQKPDAETGKKRTVRPFDDAVTRFNSAETFADHLVECAKLPDRNQKQWSWKQTDDESRKELKKQIEAINNGTEATAMLPHHMEIVVSNLQFSMSGSNELIPEFIDSRGLDVDGVVETRDDLRSYLLDPRSVIVLCASFNDAPGTAIRALIQFMDNDGELRQTFSRTLMILVDQGNADQVNGANGDREVGQQIKIDECQCVLKNSGLNQSNHSIPIIAFDVLQDNRDQLSSSFNNRLEDVRLKVEQQLEQLLQDAKTVLENASNTLRPPLIQRIDAQLKELLSHYPLSEAPLRDPLSGAYRAIENTRYASVVYATCLRNGNYHRLNLYAAIHAEAARKATAWLDKPVRAVTQKLTKLEQTPEYHIIQDHLRLRKRQYEKGQIQVIQKYSYSITNEIKNKLYENNKIWNRCQSEWGRGDGFKERVINHLKSWFQLQTGLVAHEKTDIEDEIPLLVDLIRPAQTPRFTLHVNNLRILRQANWEPTSLNVLIGANGSGKTTLLKTLEFLRIAYERNLPEAVSRILGGGGNLGSWGGAKDEPVELGLDQDHASWRIRLFPRSGTMDHQVDEQFLHRQAKIFTRDTLGKIYYDDQQIDSKTQLGLRILMDRGVLEPALRKMALLLKSIRVHHDPDLWSLRRHGSNATEDTFPDARGTNVLAVLRRWSQDRSQNHRFRFVVEGLNAAFPNTVEAMDFVTAGNTLTARFYRPGQELPCLLADEANGVLQLLVLLCQIANAEDGGVVAIDEPENGLHPYAIRIFLRQTDQWAKRHNLTVLLSTHSPVVLDALNGSPEQVFVMKSEPDKSFPIPLNQLKNTEWLAQFKLGELYQQGEIGSNEDDA
ncbi:MAG: ATP-binding protein [Magnetococcales bacterium]|nr:ATP-binding protein [Magnetococcales bacterium]